MVKLRYRMGFKSSALCAQDVRARQAWVLIKEVIDPDSKTTVACEDVAIFNLDSEAETFMRFIYADGAVEIPDDMKELIVLQRKNRQ